MGISLEELRDKLYIMLGSNEYSQDEILTVSQELDKLIINYYNIMLNKKGQ